MNFLYTGMQSEGRHKHEFVSIYQACIFLVNYFGIFAWPHTRNEHGCFALVNIANTNLLHTYYE